MDAVGFNPGGDIFWLPDDGAAVAVPYQAHFGKFDPGMFLVDDELFRGREPEGVFAAFFMEPGKF
jgi:hypothetical protein